MFHYIYLRLFQSTARLGMECYQQRTRRAQLVQEERTKQMWGRPSSMCVNLVLVQIQQKPQPQCLQLTVTSVSQLVCSSDQTLPLWSSGKVTALRVGGAGVDPSCPPTSRNNDFPRSGHNNDFPRSSHNNDFPRSSHNNDFPRSSHNDFPFKSLQWLPPFKS